MDMPSNEVLKYMIDDMIKKADERHGQNTKTLGEIKIDVREVLKKVEGIEERVTILETETKPMRSIVYGVVSLILIAVIGAIVALVIK